MSSPLRLARQQQEQQSRRDPFRNPALFCLLIFFLQLSWIWHQNAHGNRAADASTLSLLSSLLPSLFARKTMPPNHFNEIIVMGLPKSGSVALHAFFRCHGWLSSHYCCPDNHDAATTPDSFPCRTEQGGHMDTCGECVLKNLQANQPAFHRCSRSGDLTTRTTSITVFSNFHVETSDPYSYFLPQHFAIPLLHDAHPNATWIINTRSSSQVWVDHVMHWNSVSKRLWNAFGLNDHPQGMAYDHSVVKPPASTAHVTHNQILDDLQHNRLDADIFNRTRHGKKRELLQDVYNNHTLEVRRWAKFYGKHLIQINVDAVQETDKTLAQLLKQIASTKPGVTINPKCHFQFDSDLYGNDWKSFAFPF